MESDEENSDESRGSGSEFYAENSNLVSILPFSAIFFGVTLRVRLQDPWSLSSVVICFVMIAVRRTCHLKRKRSPQKVYQFIRQQKFRLTPSAFAADLRKMAQKLKEEIREIVNMRQAQTNELATMENAALRQRFKAALDKLIAKEQEKTMEVS